MTPTSRRGSCTTGETSTAPRSSVRRQRATVSSVTASCSGWPGASSSARAAASSSTCSMSKRDAVIACGDRAAPDRAQLRRDVRDLKAGAFAPTDLAAQPRERRQERALDVVRLQAPRTRLVHQRAQLGDVRVLQRVGDERALGHQLLDPTSDARVDASPCSPASRAARRSGSPRSAACAAGSRRTPCRARRTPCRRRPYAAPRSSPAAARRPRPHGVVGDQFQRRQPSRWPMRWMRPNRCSMRFGFHGRS
jgi:hypothetical protein